MTQTLREYLLSLCAAGLLAALCMSLIPKGAVHRVLGLCCACLLALTLIRPLASADTRTLAQMLARLQMQAEQARTGIEVKNRELTAAIIKQNAETYILDKASSLGLNAKVEVTVRTDAAYPYPASVTIETEGEAEQIRQLSACIVETLAIPKENQIWKTNAAADETA